MHFPQSARLINTPEFVCSAKLFPSARLGNWLSTIVQTSLGGVVVIDHTHQIVLIYREAGRMFDRPPRQLSARTVGRLMPARALKQQHATLRCLVEARPGGCRKHSRFDANGLRPSGVEFRCAASVARVTMAGALFSCVIFRERVIDIFVSQPPCTGQSEFQRGAVVSELARGVEKRYFSSVLYNDLGQSLGC